MQSYCVHVALFYFIRKDKSDPVEILQYYSSCIMMGRPLEARESEVLEGETVGIMVSRLDIFSTTMEELSGNTDNFRYFVATNCTGYVK